MFSPRHQKVIQQYLNQYAEPEIDRITLQQQYQHVVVIPAFSELVAPLRRTWSKLPNSALVILVINAPHADSRTLTLLQFFKSHYIAKKTGPGWGCYQRSDEPDLLIVERCAPGFYIPVKQGVGLARKLGADLALKFILEEQIDSRIIHNTDADALLPSNYFQQTAHQTSAASVFAYRHRLPDSANLKRGMLMYELRLQHFCAGLAWAGSHYAHHSLGSIIAVDAAAYAQVRGFPKRSTGEDFYLLNKLAKVGEVQSLEGTKITLSSRRSSRVPVGTGTGLRRLSTLNINTPYYYAPQNFHSLKSLLTAMAQTQDGSDIADQVDLPAAAYFTGSDLPGLLPKLASNCSDSSQLRRAIAEWFDGFQQLKMLHFLRDRYAADVSLQEVLLAPWLQSPSKYGPSQQRLKLIRALI